MNNPFDNSSGHHSDSSLDDLMSQLGVDAHQHNQPTDLLQSGHTDPYNQPADLLHGGHVDSLNSNIGSLDGSQMQNLHHSGWVDLPQAPGIDNYSTGYNQQLPDTYYHELPSQWQDPVGSPHHYDAGNGLNSDLAPLSTRGTRLVTRSQAGAREREENTLSIRRTVGFNPLKLKA